MDSITDGIVCGVIGKALDADRAFVKCPHVAGDHCKNPLRGVAAECYKCLSGKVMTARLEAAKMGNSLQAWIHQTEDMTARAENIDTSTPFFKNCVQHRRRNCSSCASCPFRSRIEATERLQQKGNG